MEDFSIFRKADIENERMRRIPLRIQIHKLGLNGIKMSTRNYVKREVSKTLSFMFTTRVKHFGSELISIIRYVENDKNLILSECFIKH